jgi:hypothetical protein
MAEEDLRLLDGGRGREEEVPAHPDTPTWIVNQAFERVKDVARNSLDAYMLYCSEENLPHSYLLGLDILITGRADASGKRVVDIRPTILEGPCCNSYPACPNIDSYRLYRRAGMAGQEPDLVSYDLHPTKIRDAIVSTFRAAWAALGNDGDPRVAVLTRPYEESEEESAHNLILEGCRNAGLDARRITPAENPAVKDGKLWVDGGPVDVCYRRIERIHVPQFYGEITGNRIIRETPGTLYINPWKVDDMRSKTVEERVFRRYEAATGKTVSRPRTLLGDEISPATVGELAQAGGYALKEWNSTGGKGVFLNVNHGLVKDIYRRLYGRYDGRHMQLVEDVDADLQRFTDFTEDTAVQQLRIIDARDLGGGKSLAYDTRINVLYDAMQKKWNIISGISRSVPCGPDVESGNSLLTNISAGAEVAPLILGTADRVQSPMRFGPLLSAIMEGRTEWEI